jgi:hypothetical protein
LKFDSVGRLGGITVSTVETTAITKDESFGTPAVSVATFLTREPTSKITTSGFPPAAKVFATSSGMMKAGMEVGSDPLNQMDGSGRSWLSTLLSGRLLAMPVLDLGFTHSSFNNRPMQC